jgi:hypothetical protein
MQPGTAATVRVKFSTDYFDGAGPQDEWFQGIVARNTRDRFVFEWQETVCVLTGCFAVGIRGRKLSVALGVCWSHGRSSHPSVLILCLCVPHAGNVVQVGMERRPIST